MKIDEAVKDLLANIESYDKNMEICYIHKPPNAIFNVDAVRTLLAGHEANETAIRSALHWLSGPPFKETDVASAIASLKRRGPEPGGEGGKNV